MAEQTNKQKHEFSKLLYIRECLSQKEIAGRVGVSEKTVGAWKRSDAEKGINWDKLKAALTTTKESQLEMMYEQLNNLNSDIASRVEGKRFGDSRHYDSILKLT